LAHLSGGRPGYALRLYHEPERLELRQQWLDDHRRLLGASRIERFTYADNLTKDRDRTRRALETWLTIWRDVLLRAVGVDTQITNVDRIDEIDTLASRLETPAARQAVWLMERTLALLSTNVNARLATEVMFLELPKL
jgi:DNA polymerase-3 subunit delta'